MEVLTHKQVREPHCISLYAHHWLRETHPFSGEPLKVILGSLGNQSMPKQYITTFQHKIIPGMHWSSTLWSLFYILWEHIRKTFNIKKLISSCTKTPDLEMLVKSCSSASCKCWPKVPDEKEIWDGMSETSRLDYYGIQFTVPLHFHSCLCLLFSELASALHQLCWVFPFPSSNS